MTARDYKSLMPAVARFLLGDPNPDHSTSTEWRWGRNGSLSVDLEKGAWHDHETGEAGGVLDLVRREARDWTATSDLGEWLAGHGIAANDNATNDNAPKKTKPRLVASYEYKGAAGQVVLVVDRYEPKTFRQRKPDGNGGWQHKDVSKGLTHVPYRLADLLENPTAPVYIVGGEKDVNNLRKLNILATCNAGGEGKWWDELTPWFKGRDVIILPDNDNTGRKHADIVRSKLAGVASRIRVVKLPGLPEKGDVSDWLKVPGNKGDKLTDLVAATAPEPQPLAANDNAPSTWPMFTVASLPDQFTQAPYLVKGLMNEGDAALLTGASNTGKTFVGLEMAACIACGLNFLDHKTKQRKVVYLAVESPTGIMKRIHALRKNYIDTFGGNVLSGLENLIIIPAHINLYQNEEHADQLIGLINTIGGVGLIIGDTLARMASGADENSFKDMSVVVRNIDRIKEKTQSAFMFVAHLGKNAASGVRGHSSVYAAVDTELTLKVEGDHSFLELTKARDMGGKNNRHGFSLKEVILGADEDGDPITSCVVIPAALPAPEAPKPKLGGNQYAILDYLRERPGDYVPNAILAAAIGMDKENCRKTAKGMVAKGLITSNGAGFRFKPVEPQDRDDTTPL